MRWLLNEAQFQADVHNFRVSSKNKKSDDHLIRFFDKDDANVAEGRLLAVTTIR